MIQVEAILSKQDKEAVDDLAFISYLADSLAKKIIKSSLKSYLEEGRKNGKRLHNR